MAEGALVCLVETGATLSGRALEALALGRAAAGNEPCDLLVLAPHPVNLRAAPAFEGLRTVYEVSVPPESDGTFLLAAAQAAAAASSPRIVVMSHGAHSPELAPRLAVRLGSGCLAGVTGVESNDNGFEVEAALYGGAARGSFRFRGDGPPVLVAAPGVVVDSAARSGLPQFVELAVPSVAARVRVVQPASEAGERRLEDAGIVVSGGRGLRDGENFRLVRELAEALGGMPGASRAIVDDGWATSDQQVGLTGKVVTPRLYVAAGISGASQHMAGCANSATIVAINTDPQASIFRHADFGIVGDCREVLPELIRLAKQPRG